jgi:hypothetical protein
MIINIPVADDFKNAGIDFINLAIDHVFTLYEEYEQSEIEEWGDQVEIESYWKSAQRTLSNALTLVQQGIELLLKGRIVSVSPYLLISGEPREWPRGCETRDISFSEFRTIDAQDLIRIHDTINSTRLSDSFKSRYEELRRRRNTIIHTIDNSLEIDTRIIIDSSLEAIHELTGPLQWISLRRSYLEASPTSRAFSTDHVEYAMIIESLRIIRLLSPSDLIKYFGFNKRQRRYICPTCDRNDETGDLRPDTALLSPNTPRSTSVYCFVCGNTNEVTRENCSQTGCRGNVLSAIDVRCLTCSVVND